MRRRFPVAVGPWLMLVVLFASRQAFAQGGRPLQFGAGYEYVHSSIDGSGESYPLAGYVAIEQPIRSDAVKSFGWIGQFEAGYRQDSGYSEQLYTAMGGLRVSTTKPLRWVPSGFGLIGLGTLDSTCVTFCAGTNNGIAFQGAFVMSTRLTESMLLDVAFKATKVKVEVGGVFNAAVSAGVRLNLTRP